MQRSIKDYLLIFTKGMAMGAADVVPGVSGGTIAFIAGIYEELINSIKSIDHRALSVLFKQGIKPFWKHINGTFLLSLFLGILVSVVSLAKAITYFLENEPVLIWSFFFGLIIASVLFIGKQIKKWDAGVIAALISGTAIAYYVTIAAPSQIPDGLIYVFFAGSIAICAMILPGISGSFILLLLGAYSTVLGSISGMIDALKASDISTVIKNGTTLAVFATGCLLGLLTFSHALSWMFRKAHNVTIALLTGFMVGSLNKVWPWKEVIEWRINSHGEQVPFLDRNVLPHTYEALTREPNQLGMAIGMAIIGFAAVYLLERLGEKKSA